MSRDRRIDEALVRSRAARSLVDLFDSLYEGAVLVDTQARIVWMNDKFKALVGWNGAEHIEGRPVEEVIANSRLREVVETGRAELLDIYPINNRQLVVSRIPLRDDDGVVNGALGVILYDRLQALRPIVSKFQTMQEELARAGQEIAKGRRARYRFSQFVGESAAARAIKAQARRAAARDGNVMLTGETGTGKELLAHAIHAASPRAQGPMVRVNAAAIPETLLESELFGTAPGAFTGAGTKARPGKFELAHRGTLFLDEVGDMPLSLQPKLLRALQEGEIEPLGSNRVLSVDVRVIAATSRDLKAAVDAGTFRADLFYRLNVLPLVIPPLRERRDDIPALADTVLDDIAMEAGEPPRELALDALALLAASSWPGNVRELSNVLEQATALVDAPVLTAAHLAPLLSARDAPRLVAGGDLAVRAVEPLRPLRQVMAEAERTALLEALGAAGGVKVQAARLLCISRAQLYEKLTSHGLMSDKTDMPKAV